MKVRMLRVDIDLVELVVWEYEDEVVVGGLVMCEC